MKRLDIQPIDSDISHFNLNPSEAGSYIQICYRPGFSKVSDGTNSVHLTPGDVDLLLRSKSDKQRGLQDPDIDFADCQPSEDGGVCLHLKDGLYEGDISGVNLTGEQLQAFQALFKAARNPLADLAPYDKNVHHFSVSKDRSRVYVVFQKGLTNCKGNAICLRHEDLKKLFGGNDGFKVGGLSDEEAGGYCRIGASHAVIVFSDSCVVFGKGGGFKLSRSEVERFIELTAPKPQRVEAEIKEHNVRASLDALVLRDADVVHKFCNGPDVVLMVKEFRKGWGEARVKLNPDELLALHAALTGKTLVEASRYKQACFERDEAKRGLVVKNREIERLNGEVSKLRTALAEVTEERDDAIRQRDVENENARQFNLELQALRREPLTPKQKSEIARAHLAEFLAETERDLASGCLSNDHAICRTLQINAVKSVLAFPRIQE